VSRFGKSVRRGFTLVEIMMVMAIMSVMLAIATPSLVRARNTSRAKTCQKNLKQIQGATEQYLMDNRTTVYPALAALTPTYLKTTPRCPSGGTYSMGTSSSNPSCNMGDYGTATDTSDDHILP
jgi:prepilin-type N-terminal cleavage/methylation domain-containing protein